MLTVLRLISFALGSALTFAPSFFALQFAYGVGEPPEAERYFAFFGPLLVIGLLIGLGPLLIGFPKVVAGSKFPKTRLLAGVLLVISIADILLVGFSGSVTRITSPAILLIEVTLFAAFIWPARSYFATQPINPDPPTSGARVS
jgi:hypothetical protein